MFACARRQGEGGLSESRIGVTSIGGMERGFKVIVCRACQNPPCAKACPTNALKPRDGGGVVFEPSNCIGCGKCQEACSIGAVFWNEEKNKPMICDYCGYCAGFCPHGVIELEKMEVRENDTG